MGSIIFIVVVVALRIDTHTGRTIGEDDGGDAKTGDSGCGAGSAGDKTGGRTDDRTVAETGHTSTYYHSSLLFKGHGFDHCVDVVGSELRLRHHHT